MLYDSTILYRSFYVFVAASALFGLFLVYLVRPVESHREFVVHSLSTFEIVAVVAQGENKIDEKVERNTIRKGNGLFNDKKYTEAEIEYRKALEANPSSEIATYNLGAALYKQQKWNDSLVRANSLSCSSTQNTLYI